MVPPAARGLSGDGADAPSLFCCRLPGDKARGSSTEGGWAWGQRRTRRKHVHVSSMAPCSCALPCAHGKTGVGRPAQPARGMPGAHGANGSALPPCPSASSIACARARRKLPREAGRAAQDREAHGCADRACMDVFTACPALPARPPPLYQLKRVQPQPRAFAGFTRLPKKIALISSRSVPCQYLRCAGSSANNTTLPCPCGDTSSHALPATRARLRSDR